MSFFTLILRSLRFHCRSHVGVVLGAAVGSAALIGALVVGDSVRESLRQMALTRLGPVHDAMFTGDRFFRESLADTLSSQPLGGIPSASVLLVEGTAARTDGGSRANRVQVLGVPDSLNRLQPEVPRFPDSQEPAVILNVALARHLQVTTGDTVLLRVHKPSLLSRESPISPQEDISQALRLTVAGVAGADALGRFNLHASRVAPFNAFVPLSLLQEKLELEGRVNLLLSAKDSLVDGASLQDKNDAERSSRKPQILLEKAWTLADGELEVRTLPALNMVELRTPRVYLEDVLVENALQPALADSTGRTWVTNGLPLLTYFVNELKVGPRTTPYSMVTAMGEPVVPPDMAEDEIIINQWLAEDLQAKPGDTLTLTYLVMGDNQQLAERQETFRIRSVTDMKGVAGDRELMPEFPGIAKAEKTENWDAGFAINMGLIRSQDEKYWEDHKGVPKAFVTLKTGQQMWANRFGSATAVRWNVPKGLTLEDARAVIADNLFANVEPSSLGFQFDPVRESALIGASQSQDFGGLFIGFSFFLIGAALILMALLFQFGLEQRLSEVGTLLALGFTPKQVRRLLLMEGALLACLGGVLGTAGGIGYAKAMLYGLTTLWSDAVGQSDLQFHVTAVTLGVGLVAAVLVGTMTVALVLRKQARRPAQELLNQGAVQTTSSIVKTRSRGGIIGLITGVSALAMVGWALWKQELAAGMFFGAASLLLVAGLSLVAALVAALGRSTSAEHLSVVGMGIRSVTRQRKRSLATVALLACGSFMIIAVGANKLDAELDAEEPSSGTGGFAYIGESTLPVLRDLNSTDGREFYGLADDELVGVRVVPLRVKDGDEASCLNLSRAQKPRLLGVDPQQLAERGAFTFAKVASDLDAAHGWNLLKTAKTEGVVPAIGDNNSILWALGKKVGDTLDYTDEQGRIFKIRLVAGVGNSILQGNLLIDGDAFRERFPSQSGYRMFFLNAPSNNRQEAAENLSRALQDFGMELTSATGRLAEFNAVQNTYLETFQVLGALGLLLGSAGLGVVVLRNVLERRGELALLQAVGFRRGTLHWLVLSEHGALLLLGLMVGGVAALVAVLPEWLRPGSDLPVASLALTLGLVMLSGLIWTWVATRLALKGNLLPALRNE